MLHGGVFVYTSSLHLVHFLFLFHLRVPCGIVLLHHVIVHIKEKIKRHQVKEGVLLYPPDVTSGNVNHPASVYLLAHFGLCLTSWLLCTNFLSTHLAGEWSISRMHSPVRA